MYVNGVLSPAGFVFPNQDTSSGTKLDLGLAPAGSDVVFALQVWNIHPAFNDPPAGTSSVPTGNLHYTGTPSYLFYSDPNDTAFSLSNPDLTSHAYITPFTLADTNSQFPATGVYIGFEDILASETGISAPDWNYTDEQLVVTNLTIAPEPSTMLLLFVGGTGLFVPQAERAHGFGIACILTRCDVQGG